MEGQMERDRRGCVLCGGEFWVDRGGRCKELITLKALKAFTQFILLLRNKPQKLIRKEEIL